MQAIILAGGFGTRLQSVVKDVPKPMAPIQDKPFLFYLISYLKSQGFTDIIISVGYLRNIIEEYFGNNFLGINIKYAIEEEPLGTGGAILNSLSLVECDQPLFILNGDTFFKVNYLDFLTCYQEAKASFAIVLNNAEDSSRYGIVEIDKNGYVTGFKEKSTEVNSGLINSGIYLINPESFKRYSMPKKFSFERDFLIKYLDNIKMYAFKSGGYFIDIGIPTDYQKSQQEIPTIVKNKALFLDRDGVINFDYGYVCRIDNFHFIEGIFTLCQKAQELGYLIIIVTNQSGIARGYYTEKEFLELSAWVEKQFHNHGIYISKTYYCPYHLEGVIESYRKDSEDRKPNPGMILKAISNFNIDANKSILIGDKGGDIQAAKNAKLAKSILFSGNDHSESIDSLLEFDKKQSH